MSCLPPSSLTSPFQPLLTPPPPLISPRHFPILYSFFLSLFNQNNPNHITAAFITPNETNIPTDHSKRVAPLPGVVVELGEVAEVEALVGAGPEAEPMSLGRLIPPTSAHRSLAKFRTSVVLWREEIHKVSWVVVWRIYAQKTKGKKKI